MRHRPFGRLVLTCTYALMIAVAGAANADAERLELYMDQKTKQLFAEPGKGRVKLGTFVPVEEAEAAAAAAPAPIAQKPTDSAPSAPTIVGAATTAPVSPALKQWYEKLSVRGYTQIRHTSLLGKEGAPWFHPADRSIGAHESILLRRARLILSGDVSEHLYVYLQPEFNAAPNEGDFSAQMRDWYGDINLEPEKEFRVRVGQSKVPFGFANMQSSQNRMGLERPDAINSAAEGERDFGAYLMWAPSQIRERFRKLANDKFKGSGDYGVVTVGAYGGQGLNRTDQNDQLHTLARVSYPWELSNGQIFEAGMQGYFGRFVSRTSPITIAPDAEPTTPKMTATNGLRDDRIGWSAVLYPQPIGIEAEWNIGRGPELSEDYKSIDDRFLHGGYVQASYKIEDDGDTFFPFVRWQYFDGARKFGRNSPSVKVNEWDFGIEYMPFKEVEFTAMYTFSNQRTNTNEFPYAEINDGHRLGVQVQLNY